MFLHTSFLPYPKSYFSVTQDLPELTNYSIQQLKGSLHATKGEVKGDVLWQLRSHRSARLHEQART